MADIRLQTVEREDDPPPRLRDPLQARGIGEREGEQFVVAFEQMGDCPWGDGHPAVAQVLMDFGQTPMLRVTQSTDPRNDIKPKCVSGSGQAALGFRAVGPAEVRTGPVETAPDVQGEMHDVFQSRDRAIVMIGRPHRLTAEGAMTPERLEGVSDGWGRTRGGTCHGEPFPVKFSLLYQARVTDV